MRSHQFFVKKYIDWDIVKYRLDRYPTINKHFNIQLLKQFEEKPPYFCHYMAWRLGTYIDEYIFLNFENLINKASKLKNWDKEFKSFQNSNDHGTFWSLIWQMQVADFFLSCGSNCTWNDPGPDLTVEIKDKVFHVECYTYQKSFSLLIFIEELFRKIDKSIEVDHQSFIRFSLPIKKDDFLDELFKPFLLHETIIKLHKKSKKQNPVLLDLPKESGSLQLFFKSSKNPYNPGIINNAAGDPELYLKDAINKSIANKENSNKLGEKQFRPNLLAINFLVDRDFEYAFKRLKDLSGNLSSNDFGTKLDGLLLTVCGITQSLSLSDSYINLNCEAHPFYNFVNSPL